MQTCAIFIKEYQRKKKRQHLLKPFLSLLSLQKKRKIYLIAETIIIIFIF